MTWRQANNKSGGQKGEKGGAKGNGRWQYWQGSWSPSQQSQSSGGAPWRKGHGKSQALSFPGYNAAKKEEQHIAEVTTLKDREGDGYATALQRAINQVRKAEARTRKAQSDKKVWATQWTNWVAELRRTYAREKGRYQAAITRLDREMEEAVLEQEGARAALRKVATGMEESTYMGANEHVDLGADFDAIMQEEPELEDPQESNEDAAYGAWSCADGAFS